MLMLQWFGHPMQRADSSGKTLMLGKTEGQRRGPAEDEVVGWHHQLDGQESERTPRGSEGQELGVLQSPGSQRVGHTQGLNSSHCPALVGDLNLQRRGCVTPLCHLPSPEFDPPAENHLEGGPSRGRPAPGEQPRSSPHFIRLEAMIHVSVNRLGWSGGCMLRCCCQ